MPRTVIIDGDVVVYKVAEAVADSYEIATSEDDDFLYDVEGNILIFDNPEQVKEYVSTNNLDQDDLFVMQVPVLQEGEDV